MTFRGVSSQASMIMRLAGPTKECGSKFAITTSTQIKAIILGIWVMKSIMDSISTCQLKQMTQRTLKSVDCGSWALVSWVVLAKSAEIASADHKSNGSNMSPSEWRTTNSSKMALFLCTHLSRSTCTWLIQCLCMDKDVTTPSVKL